MSKFGALAANVSQGFKVVLIDPLTDLPIKDASGKEAFVEVLSADSEKGRAFENERAKQFNRRMMRGRAAQEEGEDQRQNNIAKLAALTASWHLVDPATKSVIDVPCSEANATELYSEPGMGWLFMQAWLGANETANFIKRSSKTSSPSPSTSSAATAS